MALSFTEQFKAAQAKILAHAELVAERVVIAVGDSIIEKSVVGDWPSWSKASQEARPMPPYVPGQFIGSWHHSFGSPSDDYTSTIDKTGDSSRTEIKNGAEQEPFSQHYMTNNLGYAMALERGWSPQSPKGGIVGLTAVEFPAIVRSVVSGIGV
jgi:hypothetical protein